MTSSSAQRTCRICEGGVGVDKGGPGKWSRTNIPRAMEREESDFEVGPRNEVAFEDGCGASSG